MAAKKIKNELLPLVIRVDVPQTKFDMDAVDAEFYCVNTTGETFSIYTKGESFLTLDEDSGITADNSSDESVFLLAPDTSKLIAEVQGWEWDGHVGIELSFRKEGSPKIIRKSYNFKSGSADFNIPDSGKAGTIIPPEF